MLIVVMMGNWADDSAKTTESDYECSYVANLSDFNYFDEMQVPEYVEIEEVRHVEYIESYMNESEAEEYVEILVPGVEGETWLVEGARLNEW